MRNWFALLLLLVSVPAAAQQRPLIPDDIGAAVAEGFARPALQEFSAAATALAADMAALCTAPSAAGLADARRGFAGALIAFAPVSVLRFGPLVEANRFETLFFWPDPRGVILRQVQGLLGAADAKATIPDGLAEMSVAVRGLPALEYLLFGEGAEALAAEGGYRCRYAATVAGGIADIAAALVDGWAAGTPFATSFTAPEAGRDPYRSTREVMGEIVKAISTTLQFIAAAEIGPALGDGPDTARGRRAPFWRSDLGLRFVTAQLDGIGDLLVAADLGRTLTKPAEAAVLAEIDGDIGRMVTVLRAVDRPVAEAFAAPADHDRLRNVRIVLDYANSAVSQKLAAATGLVMGFNALDGD